MTSFKKEFEFCMLTIILFVTHQRKSLLGLHDKNNKLFTGQDKFFSATKIESPEGLPS